MRRLGLGIDPDPLFSDLIVVDGIDRYYPELRGMRERVLVIREHGLHSEAPEARAQLLQQRRLLSDRRQIYRRQHQRQAQGGREIHSDSGAESGA